jgi:hypothetical protein
MDHRDVIYLNLTPVLLWKSQREKFENKSFKHTDLNFFENRLIKCTCGEKQFYLGVTPPTCSQNFQDRSIAREGQCTVETLYFTLEILPT